MVDGDLTDELSHHAFVELGDVGLLIFQEILKFGDSALQVFLASGGGIGPFFFFSQAEDFINDGVVVLFTVCFPDELRLQFIEP